MIIEDKRRIPQHPATCQDSLLAYFQYLHRARQVADVQGKKWCRVEARRIKEKALFLESLEATA